MLKKNNKKKKLKGTVTVLLILSLVIIIASAITSKLGLQSEKTVIVNGALETSLITTNNFLSKDGIRYLFQNIVSNFQLFQPLVYLIISLMAFGLAETSGLIQKLLTPLKKVKPQTLTIIMVLLGTVSSLIGQYSYVLLLPFAAVAYKTLGRNSILGVITVFLGITLGYGAGIFINYDTYLLGTLTQTAATIDVDPNYVYHNFSTLFIMIASMIVMVPIISKLIDVQIAPKFKKPSLQDSEMAVSKKAFHFSNMALVFMLLIVAYMIIPGFFGSGLLLDKSQSTYIAQLFGDSSPFKEGILLVFLFIMMVCSYIYGKISRNIETSRGFSEALSKNLENFGFLFVILFFASEMIAILEWTNIGELIVCKLVETLSIFQFSGILLIVIFFIFAIIMTIFIPSTLTKWTMVSPLIVPLFMRANITPDLTQFIFQVADGIGKSITPFFAFFIVMIGLIHNNNSDEDNNTSILMITKNILPTVLVMAVFWIIFLIIWYLAGFPLGISGQSTL